MKDPGNGTSPGVEPAARAQASGEATRCPHCAGSHPKTWSHCPTTGKPLTTGPALVGRVVGDRYRILGLIGEGGMGAVYEAEHLSVGRRVALKRLHPELATDAHAISRFQREARAAGATGHEHVVDVLDLGFAEDGAPYLVMELLTGESLATRLKRVRQVAPRRAAAIAGQVLSALEAVHALDVIHRDLKPDNIFLTKRHGRSDYVKVLDFGVSKMSAEGKDPKLTRTGVMVGTPHYMSPEQARGVRQLDHRVDLYAVGVILYECLSGQLPFSADNYHALLQSILAREPMPLDRLVLDLEPGLVAVVQRALAKKPDDRFPTARAMWEALVPFGAEAPAALESIPAPPVTSAIGALPTTPMEGEILRAKLREAASSFQPVTLPTPPPLDPAPRAWNTTGSGRAFVATSADWSDERGDLWRSPSLPPPSESVRSESVRAASIPAPRTSTRPSLSSRPRTTVEPPRLAPTGPTRIKGALLQATREAVRTRHGQNKEAVLVDSLPVSAAAGLRGVILPMAWTPAFPFVAFLDALEVAHGATDGREARACGRIVADRELPQTHRLVLRNATPTIGIAKLPSVLRSYVDGAAIRVDSTETGSFRLELDGAPGNHPFACFVAGLVERYLELCGAREPRAWVQPTGHGVALSIRWR
ncbi:MAG: protein kinase [Sandaracinus sp.]|nr:protein kinase [Sandaracinus sp.]